MYYDIFIYVDLHWQQIQKTGCITEGNEIRNGRHCMLSGMGAYCGGQCIIHYLTFPCSYANTLFFMIQE